MKPDIKGWTIVVAGSWNAQIFEPAWVGEKLFGVKELEIEFVFHRNSVFPSLKTSDIIFSPTNSQIVCGVRTLSEDSLTKAENLIIKTLDILPYTPISAIGINFEFIEENPQKNLLDLFDFSDNLDISDFYTINERQIHRHIKIDDYTLHLRQILKSDSSKPLIIHLNFHKDTSDAREASKWLKGKVLECKSTAYKFLKKTYDLDVEVEDLLEDKNAD